MQRRLDEVEDARSVAAGSEHTDSEAAEEAEDDAAIERALRSVDLATRQESNWREWTRQAVKASGAFPELDSLDASSSDANADAARRWVCITVPTAGEEVLMDTPHGRFAVLVPSGVAPGNPLLVPVPATDALRNVPKDDTEVARERQLDALLAHGYDATQVAPYCDGVSPTNVLLELIESDLCALDSEPEAVKVASSMAHRSNMCLVS